MKYNFILNDFEGPLDLLLHLISKAKIDIYDIPINSITDQYLSYLEKMEKLNLDITSEFLVMASTLIQIKSNRLLPKKEDLEDDEEDPEQELINRLIEYKKYKEAAEEIKLMGEGHKHRFYKKQEDLSYLIEDDLALENISLVQLSKAFNKVLELNKRYTEETEMDIENLKREEYPVEESIDELKNILEDKEEVLFEDVFDIKSHRSKIISLFLAILELAKIQYIYLYQETNYSGILLRKAGDIDGE